MLTKAALFEQVNCEVLLQIKTNESVFENIYKHM